MIYGRKAHGNHGKSSGVRWYSQHHFPLRRPCVSRMYDRSLIFPVNVFLISTLIISIPSRRMLSETVTTVAIVFGPELVRSLICVCVHWFDYAPCQRVLDESTQGFPVVFQDGSLLKNKSRPR